MTYAPPWPPLRPIQNLPVWQTVTAAYRNVFVENLRHLPNAAFVPLLLSLAINLLSGYAFELIANDDVTPRQSFIVIGLAVAWLLAALPPVVLFAVSWYRLCLFGSHVASPPTALRWRRRHTVFFRKALVVLAIAAGIMILLFTIFLTVFILTGLASATTPSEQETQGIIAAIVILLPTLYVVMRLAFVFPALAIDLPSRLRLAWGQTKGQGLSLFVMCILTAAPIYSISMVLVYTVGSGLLPVEPGSGLPDVSTFSLSSLVVREESSSP